MRLHLLQSCSHNASAASEVSVLSEARLQCSDSSQENLSDIVLVWICICQPDVVSCPCSVAVLATCVQHHEHVGVGVVRHEPIAAS